MVSRYIRNSSPHHYESSMYVTSRWGWRKWEYHETVIETQRSFNVKRELSRSVKDAPKFTYSHVASNLGYASFNKKKIKNEAFFAMAELSNLAGERMMAKNKAKQKHELSGYLIPNLVSMLK